MAKSQIDYLSSAGATLAKTTFGYEYQAPTSVNRDLITGVRNEIVGQQDASLYSYTNDSLRRRTSVVYRGAAFTADNLVLYDDPATQGTFDGYNDRGELQHARRHAGDDPDVPGSPLTPNHYAYDYDDIGNRQTNAVDTAQAFYCIENNKLNQYEGVEASAQDCPNPSPQFTYDLRGNLTYDGKCNYAYDAENRLRMVYPTQMGPGDCIREYYYDYLGRCAYIAETWYGSIYRDLYLIYDGWNVVMAMDGYTEEIIRKYTWGLDLSGTLQGAGGIGGLLAAEFKRGEEWQKYWYTYDANGNVGQLLRYRTNPAETVTLAAGYEYDPYGNTLAVRDLDSSGIAGENEIRFSTKWLHDQSGTDRDLYYYGYRFYSPGLGRWLSWDPIGEQGGIGLLAFITNNPTGKVDPYGLDAWDVIKDFMGPIRAGARTGGSACTRVAGLGCVCIDVSVEVEWRTCCRQSRRADCVHVRFTVGVGVFACETRGGSAFLIPPFPAFYPRWNPAPKRPLSPIVGPIAGCPAEGISGSVCVTVSAGFSTLTAGGRGCWDFGKSALTFEGGFGVGVGTGVSIAGSGTYLKCY